MKTTTILKKTLLAFYFGSILQCNAAQSRVYRQWGSRPSLVAVPALLSGNYSCCYIRGSSSGFRFHPLWSVTSQDAKPGQIVAASQQDQQPGFYQQLNYTDTDQVHDLCTRISILLPGFAGAHVQSFTHEEDLLGMVNRQTHLERKQNMLWGGLDGCLSWCLWLGTSGFNSAVLKCRFS